jgi:hypothetical protein
MDADTAAAAVFPLVINDILLRSGRDSEASE